MPEAIHDLVPIAHVADVARSVAFYRVLGFEQVSSRTVGGVLDWVWLKSGDGCLMVARAGRAVDPAQQAILIYLYAGDLAALREQLRAAGVQVEPISHPDHMPDGEMGLSDPDGYRLLVGQLPPWRGSRR